MKAAVTLLVLCAGLNVWAADNYPIHPDANLTPGSLCQHPDAQRYPEHINYCNRNVDTDEKRAVIAEYEKLGFKIMANDRKDFKIDHFIPLCMGGSNEMNNLWPQYKTIYEQTDSMEFDLCQKMAAGEMTQAEAVKTITTTKLNLKL
jgi:hypothetical protein